MSYNTLSVPDNSGHSPPLTTLGTLASGIDANVIAGTYLDTDGANHFYQHGFLFNGLTLLARLDAPGAEHTAAVAVQGDSVIGHYSTSSSRRVNYFPTYDDVLTAFLYSIIGETFTDVVFPSATKTFVRAVYGSKCVGFYRNTEGPISLSGLPFRIHGFVFDAAGPTYTTIDPPGSLFTVCTGIDSAGNICGVFIDGSGQQRGFFRSAAGSYTTLAPPNCRQVYPFAMSGGNVVGLFNEPHGGSYSNRGFLWNGSSFTTLDFPGDNNTDVRAISGSVVAGNSLTFNGQTLSGADAFTWSGGSYTTLSPPNSSTVVGIDASGKVVGGSWLYDPLT